MFVFKYKKIDSKEKEIFYKSYTAAINKFKDLDSAKRMIGDVDSRIGFIPSLESCSIDLYALKNGKYIYTSTKILK